jgi:hypothetical protein
MSEQWHYQIRVYLATDHPPLDPLLNILSRHNAAMISQYDAFAAYLAEAESQGTENYPLYAWTKATLDDPAKAARQKSAFALRLNNQEVYPKEIADPLEADLQPLVTTGLLTRISRHDTNPANNMPIPAEYRQSTT